jgi:hypothetical protein
MLTLDMARSLRLKKFSHVACHKVAHQAQGNTIMNATDIIYLQAIEAEKKKPTNEWCNPDIAKAIALERPLP